MLPLKKYWPFLLGVVAGVLIWNGCKTGRTPTPTPPTPIVSLSTNSLQPGPEDPQIAYIAARLLETYHYLEHPLDQEMAAKFYDGYISSLDPHHEYFLQSDLAEFAPFRTNLDNLTITTNSAADLSPAFHIYQRYQERVHQRDAYVAELLEQDKFKFTGDDKYVDRRHEPAPKDLDEAKQLWRENVRYDYLTEKLSLELTETNGTITVKLPAGANTNIIAKLEKHLTWGQHLMTNQDSDTVLQIYLNALAHAYDPHTDYMSAPHAQDFSISMNLALFGIGAQLTEDYGYCTIHALVPGGPASKSKQFHENDRIIAVAQGDKPPVDVVNMDLSKVVQQIRGPKGTEVRLTISPAPDFATRKVVSLVRDEIKLEDSEAKAKLLEIPDGHGGTNRLGILDLPSFYAPVDPNNSNGHATPKYTSVDVAKLLRKLKQEHISGLIVDLRFNPGGSLEEAIRFTGLFLKGGPVVQARNPNGQIFVEKADDEDQVYDGPLIIMVNRFSASAAEIAAAALQDYGRAIIVGDISTHGKGTVQSLNQLKPLMPNCTNNPGELKITIRKFYRISGASTQLKGVTPDIILPDQFSYWSQLGESNLDNPLAWDTIQPASYEKFNQVEPFLSQLTALSSQRVRTNQDFKYVQEDIDQYLEKQSEHSVTLNEREAIKEREELAAKSHTRELEREKRPDPGVKIYELTVKNSEEAGLPPPENWLGATNGYSATRNVSNAPEPGTGAPISVKLADSAITTTNLVPVVEDKKSPPFDPMLDETEHILEDYISLLKKSGSLTVNP
jgi:carboxyl-terminal processing protease